MFGICQFLRHSIRQSGFPSTGTSPEGCISIPNGKDYSPFSGAHAQRYCSLTPPYAMAPPATAPKLNYLISSCNNTISQTSLHGDFQAEGSDPGDAVILGLLDVIPALPTHMGLCGDGEHQPSCRLSISTAFHSPNALTVSKSVKSKKPYSAFARTWSTLYSALLTAFQPRNQDALRPGCSGRIGPFDFALLHQVVPQIGFAISPHVVSVMSICLVPPPQQVFVECLAGSRALEIRCTCGVLGCWLSGGLKGSSQLLLERLSSSNQRAQMGFG